MDKTEKGGVCLKYKLYLLWVNYTVQSRLYVVVIYCSPSQSVNEFDHFLPNS